MNDNNFNPSEFEINNEPEVKQPQASYTYQYQPKSPVYNYNPQPSPSPKKEKPKKRFSALTLIVCIICSVIISSAVSAGMILTSDMNSFISTEGTSENKNYNVTTSFDNYVEAVAEACNPSVVGISVTYQSGGFPFYGFSTEDSTGSGSGVIYSTDGYIITNYHVIEAAVEYNGKIQVYLYDEQSQPINAEVVGYNSSYDLAVIKINKKGLQAINIGSAEELKVGQPCIAIGAPGGLSFMGSVNAGYISGLNRELTIDTYSMGLIQTDAAINPGNSGGALVNAEGELIGIPSVKIASTDYEGMGFAIAVNDVVAICDDIIENGGATIQKETPYLGVVIDTRYTPSILAQLGSPAGAFVTSISEGSPAEEAGIMAGDVITSINGTSVESYDDLSTIIQKSKIGDKIKIEIYRNGKTGTVEAVLTSSTDFNNAESQVPSFE